MKTGAYWFKFLTEKEQEEFKVNCGKSFDFKMENTYIAFQIFIQCSFAWIESNQSYEYWDEISQRKVE